MDIVNAILLFIVGFVLLVKGSEYLIKGASSIARLFEMSSWIIGIVIVGIGTSVPELSINIASVIKGTEVGIGAILGSNIFNILLILGLTAVIAPLSIKKSWVEHDFTANLIAVLVSGLFLFMPIVGDPNVFGITPQEGMMLFVAFVVWLWYTVRRRRDDEDEETEYKTFAFLISILMIGAGIAGVIIGGRWVVGGAEVLALLAGVPEAIVGLSVVAIGTSISELTVSVRAALDHKGGIAVGNIIGSNIFDFLGIISISSFFGIVPFSQNLSFDYFVAASAATILLLSVFFMGKYKISRLQGVMFVLLYILYFVSMIFRA